jgi:hypothetical protein
MNAHLAAMETRLPFEAGPEAPSNIATIFAQLGVAQAGGRRPRARKKA